MEEFLIDSHCHLEDETYKNNLDEIILRANNVGVKKLVCIGTDLKTSIQAIEIANKYENVYAIIGIFPEYAKKEFKNISAIEELACNEKVIAIGEIGFDFHTHSKAEMYEEQKQLFIKLIDIANRKNLPVVIHSREACDETLNLIKEHKVNRGGVFHCYSYSYEIFKEINKLNFIVGFDGPITFKNANSLRDVVSKIPLESIILETDSPYLTPVPFRGKVNEPSYLIYIAQKLSEIKKVSLDEIKKVTTKNFMRLFFNEN